MVQKIDLKHMPTKSRAWIEAERLKLARGCLGGGEIHYVAIRRLRQKDAGHNWKVADIVPRRLGAAW
jgi:hypothetical protein